MVSRDMPKAIDTRIVTQSPTLAKAIAAEHLIQVFHTHGEKMDKEAASKSTGGDGSESALAKETEGLKVSGK